MDIQKLLAQINDNVVPELDGPYGLEEMQQEMARHIVAIVQAPSSSIQRRETRAAVEYINGINRALLEVWGAYRAKPFKDIPEALQTQWARAGERLMARVETISTYVAIVTAIAASQE